MEALAHVEGLDEGGDGFVVVAQTEMDGSYDIQSVGELEVVTV